VRLDRHGQGDILTEMSERGFYSIGIAGSKTPANVGTLWRTAGNMGAAYIFTVGKRYPVQASDTIKAWKHVPLFEFPGADEFLAAIPKDCKLIGIEQTDHSRDLPRFVHPERACYVLGAEDRGLAPEILSECAHVIAIESERCLNVAVAGSIVIYDRQTKLDAAE